jgi:hypothetical protein
LSVTVEWILVREYTGKIISERWAIKYAAIGDVVWRDHPKAYPVGWRGICGFLRQTRGVGQAIKGGPGWLYVRNLLVVVIPVKDQTNAHLLQVIYATDAPGSFLRIRERWEQH